MSRNFGTLNAHIVGTLMKEAVRRAISIIRAQRFSFEARSKNPFDKRQPEDIVTSADTSAQQVLVSLLRAWFPDYGLVAEEDTLRVACTHDHHQLWFTVDPLDGTRAFMRRQSHGIGTMLSLICDGVVIGACVGDVMTQEVYYARPDGSDVHRISEFGIAETLAVDPSRELVRQSLLVCDRGRRHSTFLTTMVMGEQPLMWGVETASGSIGISFARLWKSEVGAAVFGPYHRGSPWDLYPLIGISKRLGFRFFELPIDGEPQVWNPLIDEHGPEVPHEILVVHESRLPELRTWANQLGHTFAH